MWDYKEGRLLSTVDRWMDGTKNQTPAYCVSNTDSVYIRTGPSSSSIHVYMLMMSHYSQQMVTTVTNNQNFIFNAMQHNEERNHFTMIFSNYALTTLPQ